MYCTTDVRRRTTRERERARLVARLASARKKKERNHEMRQSRCLSHRSNRRDDASARPEVTPKSVTPSRKKKRNVASRHIATDRVDSSSTRCLTRKGSEVFLGGVLKISIFSVARLKNRSPRWARGSGGKLAVAARTTRVDTHLAMRAVAREIPHGRSSRSMTTLPRARRAPRARECAGTSSRGENLGGKRTARRASVLLQSIHYPRASSSAAIMFS
jgi:hypothetical protein